MAARRPEPPVPGRRRLGRGFYTRPTLEVARDLLGRRLVRLDRGRRLSGRIVEVEAYVGPDDSACHARSGRTARNAVLFERPGRAYVYFTYGMHHLLNLVTESDGFPAAVLLRALEPDEGQEGMRRRRGRRPERAPANWLSGGPARLCRALGVDLALNGHDVATSSVLFVEEGEPLPERRVRRGPRVGIDYARPRDRDAPWRLWDGASAHVSRRNGRAR